MVKLAATLDPASSGETRAGSTPVIRTAVRLRPDFSFGLRKKSEKRRNFLNLQFKTRIMPRLSSARGKETPAGSSVKAEERRTAMNNMVKKNEMAEVEAITFILLVVATAITLYLNFGEHLDVVMNVVNLI